VAVLVYTADFVEIAYALYIRMHTIFRVEKAYLLAKSERSMRARIGENGNLSMRILPVKNWMPNPFYQSQSKNKA
jgi:hypothetical protein